MSTPEDREKVLRLEQALRGDDALAKNFTPGLYEHYKGGLYLAVELLRRETDGRICVKYYGDIGDKSPYKSPVIQRFQRPIGEFYDTLPISIDSSQPLRQPRFKLIKPFEF